MEKAAAKLPKKDLAAVKKRFAFLEVWIMTILHMVLVYICMHQPPYLLAKVALQSTK